MSFCLTKFEKHLFRLSSQYSPYVRFTKYDAKMAMGLVVSLEHLVEFLGCLKNLEFFRGDLYVSRDDVGTETTRCSTTPTRVGVQ